MCNRENALSEPKGSLYEALDVGVFVFKVNDREHEAPLRGILRRNYVL